MGSLLSGCLGERGDGYILGKQTQDAEDIKSSLP